MRLVLWCCPWLLGRWFDLPFVHLLSSMLLRPEFVVTRNRKPSFHLLSSCSKEQSHIRHCSKSLPRVGARASLYPTTSWRVEVKSNSRWRNLVEWTCRSRKIMLTQETKIMLFFFFTLITRLGKHFVFSQKRNKKSVSNFLLRMLYVGAFTMN